MSLQDRIISHFSDSQQIQQDSLSSLTEIIEFAAQRLVSTLLNDKKILVCAHGRAIACAQLLVSALLNQYERERPALPIIALYNDSVTMTAIAGDYHFDDIFSKQIRTLGQTGDILVAYSDGQQMSNLAKAINVAHDKEISVIAFTSSNETMLSTLLDETDIELHIPTSHSAYALESQVLITHCLCDLIDHQLFG